MSADKPLIKLSMWAPLAISATLQPRIFERDVSGGEKGFGLGLIICKEIIEDHGGVIEVKSKPG